MQKGQWTRVAVLIVLGALLSSLPAQGAALSADLQKALDSSTYVYIQSTRKDGTLGEPAEIWFLHHQGAVWVATPITTHRVKRIQAGQTKAKIAVGKADGPAFEAKGSIVKDAEMNKLVFETFAKKYASGWPTYEKKFRDELADGSRVLIKYEPTGE